MRWLSPYAAAGPEQGRRPFGIHSAAEALDRRADEVWQRLEVVAPFEHGLAARRRCRTPASKLAEALVGHADVRERVVDVGVEAGRDEHELAVETRESRLDH